MKGIIDGGYLYLALPPLYRISQGKKEAYAYDDNEKDLTVERMQKDNKNTKINVQRYKGLGEMNPDELWQTTLNPEERILLQVKYSNNTKAKSKKDQDLIQILMGDEVAPRRDFIINRALEVSNLDI